MDLCRRLFAIDPVVTAVSLIFREGPGERTAPLLTFADQVVPA